METVFIILTTGIINLLSFYMGLKAGNKEPVRIPNIPKIPTINPVKMYQDYKETKEQKLAEEEFETNWENINNYNGTGLGQKDMPK